ncbi:FAD-binding and (Fe-S)-binding domain-containing protein [Sphingomonas sanguinis]|jgi:FAD/FMN-containing dehydrogenase/Fe-S oxidoreductase|uniref:D-2-hydroxyglutarate dehydrogenase n=1 Tax=Sphingomonas sanguinis TaxID=33051 RepID=A0A7Y7QVZ0_9SPHN|nr:FAD-binding and (Fe-S)-binding domain-containing protein [Sphingomonas sanguinis]MBZ6382404.1 FAD-binding oxidoreductase [Sphingomonas sanguinis]NNG50595.1 FAD-binding oxidoreductase [Sphingomonas sanguinis]NNG54673.1 FAD-binding oxidoreductase [Sphingomonas sanguinis]NVP31702.1 FAD-binding oxidoreductase [Sphingomonas sanguinis]
MVAVANLLRRLDQAGFAGDAEDGVGARQVASTDNSIYQVRPAAIVYPRTGDDVTLLVRTLADTGLSLTARGGNTGTNGQSLNDGIIVDFARHMRGIGAFDHETNTVTVEPGVVLDQLNAFLKPHGRFFPPMVSTASRATIGGMVATDASGKGSRRWGKTSDYIAAMDLTLSDGTPWRAEPMTRAEAERIAAGDGIVADIHREALRIVTERADDIAAIFPEMNRGLTGYNLQKTWDAAADRFFLGYLLAGSEGTLAITRSISLRVAHRPKKRALAVIRYAAFDTAMRDVQRLIAADPVAIEILDDKVLGVARSDIIWSSVEGLLGGASDAPVAAMNFVEFTADDDSTIDAGLTALADIGPQGDMRIVRDDAAIGQLWTLREKSVGLLARLGGARQGIPFVEDTAVPPEKLADFVAEFRALLDGHGLNYGMFGHADVGCLHVRPFLDLRDPAQAALIRPISDEVARLTKSYGGLLWGEHGRGYRGEFSPLFFGSLYPELQALKAAFDPHNRLNPGKLAAPAGQPIDRIDGVPLRGEADRRIDPARSKDFDRAVACNGNGACFAWDSLDVMCPSYKATRDRAQSPKGRASLLRAWARLDSIAEPTPAEVAERDALAADTQASLATCLSCKACTTLCPVKVDVPTMKSRFAERYWAKRPRPLRHRVVAQMEAMLATARKMPGIANGVASSDRAKAVLERTLGYVDLPAFAVADPQTLPPVVSKAKIDALPAEARANIVILVEDNFTASFDGPLVVAAGRVLTACGYTVLRLPPRSNGKVLHLLGLRDRFARIAAKRMAEAKAFADLGVRLVGLDAATALMFTQEFTELTGDSVEVAGLETLLAEAVRQGRVPAAAHAVPPQRLLGHCTEQALRPQALALWAEALAGFGIAAQPTKTGCCGMAGLFGHEAQNQKLSRDIFALSWADATRDDAMLATGFSCRCQTKRLTGRRPLHPVEMIDRVLAV